MPESYRMVWEDEYGRQHGCTVTSVEGAPSLPIASQPPYKRLRIRNLRRLPAAESAVAEDRPASVPVGRP